MRRTLASLAVIVGLMAFSGMAQARTLSLGPRLSVDADDDFGDNNPFAIGLELRVELAALSHNVDLQLRPSFDLYFIDNVDMFNVALDFLFAFYVGNTVEPYVGAGLGIFFWDPDGPRDGNTDAGLNLVGGVKFLPAGRVQPYIELRPTIGDVSPLLLTIGVLFAL